MDKDSLYQPIKTIREVPISLSQRFIEHIYKTLSTSIIFSPISQPREW